MPGRPAPMGGRPPGVGALRVGCMGRRSPGRNGGREPGAPGAKPGAEPGAPVGVACPGRGRWKMGCPRTGKPVRLPAAGGGCGARGGGGGGAVYTGRGPVCGTIMRRAGAPGWPAAGGRADPACGGLGAAVLPAPAEACTAEEFAAGECAAGAPESSVGGGTAASWEVAEMGASEVEASKTGA